jgi:hypothetical protein
LMYFIHLYENRIVKPIEIVVRIEEDEGGKMMDGVNLTKVCCEHIWKCHSDSPLYN